MRSPRLRLQFVLRAASLLLLLLSNTRAIAQVAPGTPLWTNYYGQSGIASGVATDPLGNIVLIGYDFATSSPDFITLKLSPEGLPLWTNRFDASGYDQAQAVAIDSGTIFVTGSSIPGSDPANYVTLAYSSDGSLLWSRTYNGSGNKSDSPRAIAVDNQGQ